MANVASKFLAPIDVIGNWHAPVRSGFLLDEMGVILHPSRLFPPPLTNDNTHTPILQSARTHQSVEDFGDISLGATSVLDELEDYLRQPVENVKDPLKCDLDRSGTSLFARAASSPIHTKPLITIVNACIFVPWVMAMLQSHCVQ
ncbi:hypothetical protein BJ138DRAFT_1107641 [Hygrophoropsis aurantiaca]|uniref:Uncharacterized protein n=1 Tax=Hygrophoropsis aurantiaca TaxID=72124 RepID=A0ACB7ZRN6_9AGAM|nr:hypothetical protein BJ138DRAFT_1107641 [Hygrophoropsis aurantiaca]